MLLNLFFNTLWTQIMQSSYLEIIAAVCGVLSVLFARKENVLVFPIGIISTAIYVYILFKSKLYAVSGINLYYTLVSIYGWYAWLHVDKNNETLKITYNTRKNNLMFIIITSIIFISIYYILNRFIYNSNILSFSSVVFLDAFTTSTFAIAMILETRKKVESWIYWIIGDAISIPFYFSQGLIFTAIQYMVFLGIAISAYVEWVRREKIVNKRGDNV